MIESADTAFYTVDIKVVIMDDIAGRIGTGVSIQYAAIVALAVCAAGIYPCLKLLNGRRDRQH